MGPFVFSTYREDNIKPVYIRVMNYVVSATLLIVIGLSLFSHEILIVFTTPQYHGAYVVVPLLALYLAFYHLGLRMSLGIHIAKKTFHFTWISAVTAAVNIGLNFLLVPPYGMIGAATATLACSIVWYVLLVSISQRYYHIAYNFPSFFKILIVAAIIIAIHYFLLSDVSLQNILIKIVLISVFLVSLYIFHLIGRDELRYLRNLARRVG